MSVTIKDIAHQAGVSFSTVSKALRNSPLVQDSTKQKVLQIAAELGYHPNSAARRLVSKKSWAIGVVWPSVERVTPSTLITLINEQLEQHQYTTLLSMGSIDSAIDVFNSFQTDAILVFYDRDQRFIEQSPFQTNIPLLYYGIANQTPYLTIDALRDEAIKLAVDHLAGLGHSRIAYLGVPRDYDLLQQEKIDSYGREMTKRRLEPAFAGVQSMEAHDGYDAARQLLQRGDNRPTAVISGSYDLTRGLLRAAGELKLAIPQDLSVIGYDQLPKMNELEQPITSTGVDVAVIASTIADTLLRLAQSEQPLPVEPETIRLQPELVNRGSTCPPSTRAD